MRDTLLALGFGPSFVSWVDLFYCNVQSCVDVNGHLSSFFPLSRGVRQGCPLSPLLYVLVAEVLACKIRANPRIIVPANHTLTTQFVFGQERSLFPHPKTRNINHGKSWKIKRNKPLCHLPCREEIQKQGGWVGEKLHDVQKQCDRFESNRN